MEISLANINWEMLCLVFRAHQKKGSEAFGSFPFSHLSGCVSTVLFLSPAAAPCVQCGYFWNLGDSARFFYRYSGVLHLNEIPWCSLQQQEVRKEFLENPPKLLHSSELMPGRGKSSQTTNTEWFVPPKWGSSWAWQDSRLPEKPGRAGSAAGGCVTGFSVQTVQYCLKKSHCRVDDNQLMILPGRLFLTSDKIPQDLCECPKRRVWLLMGCKGLCSLMGRVFFPCEWKKFWEVFVAQLREMKMCRVFLGVGLGRGSRSGVPGSESV